MLLIIAIALICMHTTRISFVCKGGPGVPSLYVHSLYICTFGRLQKSSDPGIVLRCSRMAAKSDPGV